MTRKTYRDAIVGYIQGYTEGNGYPPSVRDIARAVGTVESNVYYHLLALERDGIVRRKRGTARTWSISPDSSRY